MHPINEAQARPHYRTVTLRAFENISGRFHPEDYVAVRALVAASTDPSGSRRFELEHRIVRTDNVVRWIRVRGRTLFDDAASETAAVRGSAQLARPCPSHVPAPILLHCMRRSGRPCCLDIRPVRAFAHHLP